MTISDELSARYHQWMEAVKNKDMVTLQDVLAAEYSYTGSGQGRHSRDGYLRTVPSYDLRSFEFLDIDVRAYGDVAVGLPHYRQEAVVDGVPRSGEFFLTDVWVRRDGRWQVVARSSILA